MATKTKKQDAKQGGERRAARARSAQAWFVPLVIAFALALPAFPFADRRLMDIAILVMTYVMLGWGLNIVVGLAGLLDLGYVAFYAVGAYSYALLAKEFGFSFFMLLPLAGCLAAFWGILLGFPVLRLRGDYLAIMGAGAYGYVLSSNYNARPRPAEVLVDGDSAVMIRNRETLEDL